MSDEHERFAEGLRGWQDDYLLQCFEARISPTARKAIHTELQRRGLTPLSLETPRIRTWKKTKEWLLFGGLVTLIAFGLQLANDKPRFKTPPGDDSQTAVVTTAYRVDVLLIDHPALTEAQLERAVDALLLVLNRKIEGGAAERGLSDVRIAFYKYGFPVAMSAQKDAVALYNENCKCIAVDMHRVDKLRPAALTPPQWLALIMGHEAAHLRQSVGGGAASDVHVDSKREAKSGISHPDEIAAEREGLAVSSALEHTAIVEYLPDGQVLDALRLNPYSDAPKVPRTMAVQTASSFSRHVHRVRQFFE